MKDQITYTEEILFNNYMVSSLGEEYVHSQIPYYIDRNLYNDMVFYSEKINKICMDILNNCTKKHKRVLQYFDDFKYKEQIFNVKQPISPMYWTRYDTFIDNCTRIKFAEFNYDKPCGQKEIHLAEKLQFSGNANKGFIEGIVKEFENICKKYSKENNNIGFLIDPCHYEELHHSYYFKTLLKEKNINVIPVGPDNLSVQNNKVYAYSSINIKVIFRLFPTEFFYEIRNIEEILKCFHMGTVKIINDPRVIAIQSKGIFAYLWDLVKEDSNLLSVQEKRIIKECIPYTEILDKNNLIDVFNLKNNYVVKSSLGRYSEEVYIGNAFSQELWETQLREIEHSKKMHIVQEFIHMKPCYTYAPDVNNTNIPMLAYGNFGMYMMDKSVQGILVRWSTNFLTDDNYTWMCPIGIDEFPIQLHKNNNDSHIYEELSEYIAFKYNFTGEYTKNERAISLDYLTVTKDLYEEIIYVCEHFSNLIRKIYPHIQKNIESFGPILGIPEKLYKIVMQNYVDDICALGRIDLAIDNNKKLKLLEFNSETPAGIIEALGINRFIKYKYLVDYLDPNENLRKNIKEALESIIQKLNRKRNVKNIAVVTSWHYEDIYNTSIIAELLREFEKYNVIFGNIYDLKTDGNEIFLYDQKIDAIYRYYPLDWFYNEEEMHPLIDALNKKDYMINPGHTLITQSKVFFALLYELIGKEILSQNEEKFITQYIPYTTLERDRNLSSDYIIKSYLGREGQDIIMSYEENDYDYDYEDFIFQDRCNIRPIYMDLYNVCGKREEYQFPIIGAYIARSRCAGLYTRMGNIITNKNAIYIPTYIK